jgi:hypothetical protein
MDEVAADPPAIILSFVESLPRALKSDILLFVMIYATDIADWSDQEHLAPALRDLLGAGSPYKKFGSTLRVISVLDYVLVRHGRKLDLALERMQELQSDQTHPRIKNQFRAGHASRQRHITNVTRAWRNLRVTSLNHASLMAFEDSLQDPDRPTSNIEY